MALPSVVRGSGSTSRSQFDHEGDWYRLPVSRSKRQQIFPDVQKVATDRVFRKAETEEPLALLTGNLNEFIAFELSMVLEVEFVFTAFRNNVFYVWVVVNLFEQEVRERIYEREKAIIDEFSMFEFDFYIVARSGRDVQDLISDSITLAYERVKES